MTTVRLEIHDDGRADVVLSRPERKNAINGPLAVDLAAAMSAADSNDAVPVVVLRGDGGAFCSGLDLKEFNQDPKPDWHGDFQTLWRAAHKSIFECRKPIVGALERYAINGGAALALACDLLVAGESAFLHVGEVQQGMAAPYNIAWLRLRHSEALAARVALIGRRMPGPELLELGLATQVAADDAVLTDASALAGQLAEYPPGALARIKAAIRSYGAGSADAWFDVATEADPIRTLAPKKAG